MSDAAPEGAPVETAAPESAAPDFSPVNDRIDQLAGQFGQMAEQFQGFMQAQQPQAEPEDPWAGLFPEEPQADPYQQQQQQQPGFDRDALQQAFTEAVQQANAPLAAELQRLQQQAALNDLTTQYPALKDPAVARATQEQMAQSISHLSPEVQQALIWDPKTIGMFFQAAEAQKLAQAQEPPGEASQLEAAGGAHPGGAGEQPNPVHQAFSGRVSLPSGLR